MSAARVLEILKKDLRIGPRSPVFLWVLVLPLLITFVLQVAFGSLFDPKPRLGIVDAGASSITAAMERTDGVEVTRFDDADTLKRRVRDNDLDAGLVLPAGFDDQVAAGARPLLEMYVGGESLASNRIILAVTTLDLVRELGGRPAPVTVDVVALGDSELPVSTRLVPLIVMYALLIAAVFLPSFSIADEREKGTIRAVVVTPVKLTEVMAAKGMLGLVLALPMAIVTLWLNDGLGARWVPLVTVLAVAALLCAEIGLIYGAASKNVNGVFTLIKGTGFLLMGPTVFYLFPDWPQWIAKLFPTYWVINPIHEVTVNNAGLGDVGGELAIGLLVIAALVAPLGLLVRRLRAKLATG